MSHSQPDTEALPVAPGLAPRSKLTVVAGPDFGAELVLERGTYRLGTDQTSDLILTDPSVSRTHLVIRVLASGIEMTDPGSTNGSFLKDTRFSTVIIQPPREIRLGRTELRLQLAESPAPARAPSHADSFGALRGKSLAMRELFALLERLAPTDSDLLLQGETGTGKELCAEAIHSHSSRAARPLVVCDLASVAPTLLESELFGHVKGAFTGAVQERAGAFERAHQGTLFLDEVGDLSLELQPRLLRALERRQVKRLGANEFRTIDARVIAATHRDLLAEVRAGRFREDLYHRLAVLVVRLPPLRERADDVLELAAHFIRQLGGNLAALTPETAALLRGYAWPGNVRELKNVVERVVRLGEPAAVPDSAPHRGAQGGVGTWNELPFKEAKERLVDVFERDYVQQLLASNDGNVSRAAKHAGIVRAYLQRLMKKHGLRSGSVDPDPSGEGEA